MRIHLTAQIVTLTSRIRLRTAPVAMVAVLVLSLFGCTKVTLIKSHGARHPYTIAHTLRIAALLEPGSLNSHLDSRAYQISALTMAYLLRSARNDLPTPELATAVPTRGNGGVSVDGKTIIYHLRRDAQWSDGVPFSAQDVIFSTKVVLDPLTNEIDRGVYDDIDRILAPDHYTIVLHLKRPNAGFVYDYFYSVFSPCILPAHLLSRLPNINRSQYNALPVGIGPFTYVRWDRGYRIVLQANHRYFRGPPKLAKIEIKFYDNVQVMYAQLLDHSIDLVTNWDPLFLRALNANDQLVIRRQSKFGYWTIIPNVRRSSLSDTVVRRALRLALDRRRMRQLLHADWGQFSESPYTTDHPMFHAVPFVPHDSVAAKRLLEKAGWRLGSDGIRVKGRKRLQLTVVYPAGVRVDPIVELLRINLADVGVDVNTRHYALSVFLDVLRHGNFDLAINAFLFDAYGDVSDFFGCKKPAGNFGNFCDRRLDRLMGDFNEAYDEGVRKAIATQIQDELFATVPMINIAPQATTYLFDNDVRDFMPNHSMTFDDFMYVDI